MARFNAMDVTWEKVEVLEKEGLFTCLRVDRTTIPKGWIMYEVRHDDDHWNEPVQIGLGILVNHFGTLLVREPFELEPSTITDNAYLDIDPNKDWNFIGETVSLKEGA